MTKRDDCTYSKRLIAATVELVHFDDSAERSQLFFVFVSPTRSAFIRSTRICDWEKGSRIV